jgi:hypothetical protein
MMMMNDDDARLRATEVASIVAVIVYDMTTRNIKAHYLDSIQKREVMMTKLYTPQIQQL